MDTKRRPEESDTTKRQRSRTSMGSSSRMSTMEQPNQMFRSVSSGRQRQPQQQQQQQLQLQQQQQSTTFRRQLGNKDLIIRMLAEVFQVNQSHDGQMRWEQVSSSLVPVSLYSRSTSNWLNYLLSASSVAAVSDHSGCAMSPDSRDFLLLLQQFHQQNRPKMNAQLNSNNSTTTMHESIDQYENCVVFQVVAHDYIEGQCRKVLNVKLAQPGTRLGQASEYFVYWKEQQQFVMQQQQPQPQQIIKGRRRFVVGSSSSLRYLSASQQQQQQQQQQNVTWGLNFASVNDAKLFYDICSLNLVDLDFNSEYLRQLMRTEDRNNNNNNNNNNKFTTNVCQQQAHLLQMPPICDNSSNCFAATAQKRQQRLQKVIRKQFTQTNFDDQVSEQKQTKNENETLVKSRSSFHGASKQQLQQADETTNIKCQSCQQHDHHKQQPAPTRADWIACPIHTAKQEQQQQPQQPMRLRSKSSSSRRLPATGDNCDSGGRVELERQRIMSSSGKRSRSFSTPASPENPQRDADCPVHSQRSTDQPSIVGSHHPRCLNYIRQMQLQQQIFGQSIDSERTTSRQARSQVSSRSGADGGDWLAEKPQHQSSVNSGQSLHAKRAPKARYMGHLGQRGRVQHQQQQGHRQAPDGIVVSEGEQQAARAEWRHSMPAGATTTTMATAAAIDHQINQEDLERASKFVTSRSAQRRSTACEASGSCSPSHRNARLARAQYANSKNMKEFLSLDVGGIQQQQQQLLRQPKKRQQQQQETRPTTTSDATKAANSSAEERMGSDENGASDWQQQPQPQQTVGTTTDDLPLDPATRKRMFRLTSDEAISERTEPRSSMSTQTTLAEKAKQRAASLGPNSSASQRALSSSSRQQQQTNSRSDASRRRSLERTSCVDLDLLDSGNNCGTLRAAAAATATATAATTTGPFRKSYCLSPLPQSSKSSPSVCGGAGETTTTRPTQSRNEQQQQQQHLHYHHQNLFRSTPDMSQLPLPLQQQQQQQQHQHQANCCSVAISGAHNGDASSSSSFQQQHQLSYAIPLAAAAAGPLSSCFCQRCQRRHQHDAEMPTPPTTTTTRMRQSRSCPNSLRRKARQPPDSQPRASSSTMQRLQHCQQQLASQNLVLASSSRATLHLNDCQCQVCPRISANQSGVRPSSVLLGEQLQRPPNFCPLCRESGDFVCAQEHPDAEPAGGLCVGVGVGGHWLQATGGATQAPGSACMNNVSSGGGGGGGEPAQVYSDSGLLLQPTGYCVSSVGLSRRQQQQHYRPCSSLSSRSPLRFGLYESDFEDEDGDYDDQQQQQQQYRDGTCPCDQACCPLGADQNHPNYNYNRHRHHHHHQHHHRVLPYQDEQSCLGEQQPFRPVLGYDQTMARSSLKCRQRARSQPPPTRVELANDQAGALHLNKSVENVQKLIREVQNELDALRPIASGLKRRSPDAAGTARTQADSSLAAANNDKSSLQPFVRFDWRLIAERGLRCYGHFHRLRNDAKTVASCELNFLLKMSMDEENVGQQQKANNVSSSNNNNSRLMSLSSATRPAGQFKCVGAIRKAGFLSVKKWILKRKQSIELARKQGWKRYWVCLRGTTLLFYSVVDKKDLTEEEAANRSCLLSWIQSNCANEHHSQHLAGSAQRESLLQCYIEKEPRHLIIIEGAIAQPIPEHPKRDFVFCLSTTFGDAYLFQSACQLESDNWISAIHNACAASIARDLRRDEATKLFENKIRHLEIEAEKKLFLRQRLESRLTSMGHLVADNQQLESNQPEGESRQSSTMRPLLTRLNHQLVALDAYIEQVHCEIYQLRCYIASCGSQRIFYQQQPFADSRHQHQQQPPMSGLTAAAAADLPHPKALLMYVSKPTKLLLIKLGIFTVSSFHAYIHAREGSAETILQRIQRQSSSEQSPTVELRVRSRSLSEQMLSNRLLENVQLENETEKLIDLANFKQITVQLSKSLHEKIKLAAAAAVSSVCPQQLDRNQREDDHNDPRYSVHDEGEHVLVNMRIHPSSTTLKIIKQLLNSIEPNLPEMDFLSYYLRFDVGQHRNARPDQRFSGGKPEDEGDGEDETASEKYVTKRSETIADWSSNDLHSLELVEKIVFRLDLSRRQIEEESAPFGISVGVQLFEGKIESLLSVHCSYIEWGSVADKAGLKDDDELLVINGVPVMDLDMMFVESLIQDDTRLRLVVRSSRLEAPSCAIALDSNNWRSPPGSNNGDDAEKENNNNNANDSQSKFPQLMSSSGGQTQVISDEYISSLVCPPPPNKASAFFRVDSSLLRQKSDMTAASVKRQSSMKMKQLAADDRPVQLNQLQLATETSSMTKARSQHNIDSSPMMMDDNDLAGVDSAAVAAKSYISSELMISEPQQTPDATSLASQLRRKTEQLTRLLGKTAVVEDGRATASPKGEQEDEQEKEGEEDEMRETTKPKRDAFNPNAVERLRKSILELIETEFAYIKHLETICEHYMSPLEGMSFLNISDLRHLNEIVSGLIGFQREFFDKLARGIGADPTRSPSDNKQLDEYEELNRVVQYLDSIQSCADFAPTLKQISQTFLDEAEKFKIYSAYCAAYSRLQKLLHPKRSLKVASAATVIASPNALDTFLLTNGSSSSSASSQIGFNSGGGQVAGGGSRDFLKPLGSFMGSTGAANNNQSQSNLVSSAIQESKSQLKQLNEFLGHLDSSSSSVSLSLPKSSGSSKSAAAAAAKASSTTTNRQQQESTAAASTAIHATTTTTTTFQKSAHQQSFESYLIKPIQRIVKYPMLLNSIAVSAAQAYAQAPGLLEDLQKALKHMESITSHVNDSQRVHDEFGSIFELIERQFIKQLADTPASNPKPVVGPHQPTIGLGIEQLLYFGQVDWLNILEFNPKMKRPSANLSHHLFVFASCVVFVCKELVVKSADSSKKQKAAGPMSSFNSGVLSQRSSVGADAAEIIRYQSLIPVSEVQVRSVPSNISQQQQQQQQQPRSTRFKCQWELFRCSSVNSNSSLLTKTNKRSSTSDGKVYLLASPSNEARSLFLRKIRYIIRESVRNMSLPLTRSPSSKSLSPIKKLSSSSNTNTNSSCSQSTSLSPVITNERKYIGRDESNYATSIEVNN